MFEEGTCSLPENCTPFWDVSEHVHISKKDFSLTKVKLSICMYKVHLLGTYRERYDSYVKLP